MPQASALVRQSHAVLSGFAATTPGWRAAAKKVLEQEIGGLAASATSAVSTSSFSHQASSSNPASSSSGTNGTTFEAHREVKRSIPPSFFQSTSPFLYSGKSGKVSSSVPEIEPFSLQSHVVLRDELLKSLDDETSGARFDNTWEAYIALSQAPVTDGPIPGTTVVNLLPYIDIEVHQAVLRRIVPKRQGHIAYVRAYQRRQAALAEEVPVVGFRLGAQRPGRKRHLRPIHVSSSSKELIQRAPYILEQMHLASVVQHSHSTGAESDLDVSAPTTDDFNIVLSMLADTGHVVPLSKVWCSMLEWAEAKIGPGPDTRSYATVVRGLYVHLQHQLNAERKKNAVTKARMEQSLETATFMLRRNISFQDQEEPTTPSAESDLPRQKAVRIEQLSGGASGAAKLTNLAVTRLRTIFENLDAAPLNISGSVTSGLSKYWRRHLVDYALRILRLGGDLQGMAVLIREEFGLRIGHPDVMEDVGPQSSGSRITIHALNTVLMALGEHAFARDMVVAYESLVRPLPSDLGAGMDLEVGSIRKGKWQSPADDEEDEGLFGIGSGDKGQVAEGSERSDSRLFKLDWSVSNFRQDAASSGADSTSSNASDALVQAHTPTSAPYAIHPTTTTLRTLLRHLCIKVRPVTQSYGKLSKTPLPRGDWTVRTLRPQPTDMQLRRMITDLHDEDDRRQQGQYILLALAYAKEGVEAYQASIGRMASALKVQNSHKDTVEIFEPPPLMPTAACFAPILHLVTQRKKMGQLRSLKAVMLDSVEAMRREQEVLSRAAERWAGLYEAVRTEEIQITGSASSALEASNKEGQQDLQQRKRVLREVVAAIERQSALVDEELENILAVVYGSANQAAYSEALAEEVWQAEIPVSDGKVTAATLDTGGIDALIKAMGKHRRQRTQKHRAKVMAEYRAQQEVQKGTGQERQPARAARRARKAAATRAGSISAGLADQSLGGQRQESAVIAQS
ncbi:hypothetical protein A4X13_0g2875 [Tilletia indica]|uniref:Uncharacterized protein n=1 Tax=Tilletia indica TaxID=43049 RepID=A0A177TRN9_9BASI|nr:hypothetical protein A4X13_0g2875 [Tilletia indica]